VVHCTEIASDSFLGGWGEEINPVRAPVIAKALSGGSLDVEKWRGLLESEMVARNKASRGGVQKGFIPLEEGKKTPIRRTKDHLKSSEGKN